MRSRWPRRDGLLSAAGVRQLALLGGVDERGDLVRGEELAHRAAPARAAVRGLRPSSSVSGCWPAQRTVTSNSPTEIFTVRPVFPPVCAALIVTRCLGQGSPDGRLIARADVQPATHLKHPRASRDRGLEPSLDGAGLAHLVDQLGYGGVGELAHLIDPVIGFGQDDVCQAGDAGRAVDDRQSDARAQAEGDELFVRVAGDHHLTHASRRHRYAEVSKTERRQQIRDLPGGRQ